MTKPMDKLQISKLKLQGNLKPGNPHKRTPLLWCLRVGVSVMLEVFGLMLLTPALSAQSPQAAPAGVSSRYLLIVETSRAMQPRAAGVQRAVRDLLTSGMGGQLRRGDTLGVWSYNQSLYAGKFPLQKWSAETKDEITGNIVSFIAGQTYEKKADFNQVLPALEKLVTGSDYLTIIFVTEGEQKITGTPFNNQINQFFQLWRDQQRKAQMPFLTILRASHGEITHYALNTAPWTVQMPPLAPEIQALVDADRFPVPAKVQTSSVPPLIIRGKNSGAPAPQTNAPLILNSANASTAKSATNPSTATLAEPLGSTGSNPAPSVVADSPTNKAKITGQSAEPPTSTKLEPKPQNNSSNKTVASAPEPAPISGPPAETHAGSDRTSTPPSSPDSQTVATARSGPVSRTVLLVSGAVLLAVAIGVVFVLVRRSRSAPQASLITRSVDRKRG
jgi:hypothetical protein